MPHTHKLSLVHHSDTCKKTFYMRGYEKSTFLCNALTKEVAAGIAESCGVPTPSPSAVLAQVAGKTFISPPFIDVLSEKEQMHATKGKTVLAGKEQEVLAGGCRLVVVEVVTRGKTRVTKLHLRHVKQVADDEEGTHFVHCVTRRVTRCGMSDYAGGKTVRYGKLVDARRVDG